MDIMRLSREIEGGANAHLCEVPMHWDKVFAFPVAFANAAEDHFSMSLDSLSTVTL
jgi:hypothetical protein